MDKPLVLIVDDETLKREIIRDWASIQGYECEIARSAPEGWEKLKKKQYHLLITDNRMPYRTKGEDDYDYSSTQGLELLCREQDNQGLQLIRRIRNDQELKDMDIVLYTGSEERAQARALGATFIGARPRELSEYLSKHRESLESTNIKPQTP